MMPIPYQIIIYAGIKSLPACIIERAFLYKRGKAFPL